MPNRLATAISPYLRSHADNPVDWFEWGAEAFAEAARRDVPVLVSIGYSTCHWCHVMARESFSDPALAAQLNAGFVAIKVDREEYPDVDASFLAAASAFTDQLGWPLNMFVTPAGGPFFAGTYWPPEAVSSHPAFRDVLTAVSDAWRDHRTDLESNAAGITAALSSVPQKDGGALPSDFAPMVQLLLDNEDERFGGFGTGAKFPIAPIIGFGLDAEADSAGRALAERTLATMAESPLRDAVEGGFFRYSTMRNWGEPHYERMLYDNALLLGSYARVGDVETASGIADFLFATLRLPGGAFASAQDSESTVDGARVEGEYYRLSAEARAQQPAPAVDAKILTGWNGLAIENLALAGALLDQPLWVDAAQAAADYLLEHHVLAERLARASIAGTVSSAPATLEDYGMFASGLLQLAIATGEERYASAARELIDASVAGDRFVAPGGAEPLLASLGLALEADPSEGAYASGISAMAAASFTLWLLTGEARYRTAAVATMASIATLAAERPMSFGAALGVMRAIASEPTQLVVVGEPEDELSQFARRWHRPGAVAVAATGAQAAAFEQAGFELFASRTTTDGRATAYACREFVCELPVHSVAELSTALEG